MDGIAVHLNLTQMEDWYNVNRKHLYNLDSIIKSSYSNSFVKLITSTYPEHHWEIWRFEVANGFWAKEDNQQLYILLLFVIYILFNFSFSFLLIFLN